MEIPSVLRLNRGTIERLNGWVSKWQESAYASAFSNNFRSLTTKADTKTNPALGPKKGHLGDNRDQYFQAAEYFPVVTGSFGLSDTLASVLPKMNAKLFNPVYQDPKDLREGERTIQDALILSLLKDISKAQDTDYSKTNSAHKGTSNTDYMQKYNWYLEMRDAYLHKRKTPEQDLGFFKIPEQNVGSFKDWLTGFGIMDFILIIPKMIIKYLAHYLVSALAAQIVTAQTALQMQLNNIENGSYKLGTDPTHTQLAKDNPEHILHNLAAEMAIYAVREMGKRISEVWYKSGVYNDLEVLANNFMKHPVHTETLDPLVIKWAQTHTASVAQAADAGIVVQRILDTVEELGETAQQLQGSKMLDKILGHYAPDKNSMLAGLAKIKTNNALIKQRAEIIKKNMEKEKQAEKLLKQEGLPASKTNPAKKH